MALTSTARQIIEDALDAEGFLEEGNTPSAYEMSRGLRALNVMLHAWQAKQLTVPAITSESFALVVGQSVYTIGTGGDFSTARPLGISAIYLRDSAGTDYPTREIDLGQWSRISTKSTEGRPRRWYYEPEDLLGRLRFDLEPDAAYTLFLHALKPFTHFTTLDTSDSFPDEWIEAMKYNLAVRLVSGKGREARKTTIALAVETLRDVKAMTRRWRVPLARVDSALLRPTHYNIQEG